MKLRLKKRTVARFWCKVAIGGPDECWNWKGKPNRYGTFFIPELGRPLNSHRAAYLFHYTKLKLRLCVCHSCDNKRCCNPKHLWQGTHQQNMDDMVAKGRANTSNNFGGEAGRIKRLEHQARGEAVALSKLNADKVIAMRKAYAAGESQDSLAKKYNVVRNAVFMVVKGLTWKHVGGPITSEDGSKRCHKLNEATVKAIKLALTKGIMHKVLAKRYKVSKAAIGAISQGRVWKHV